LSRRQFLALIGSASAVVLVACTPPAASSQTSGGNATPATQKKQLIFWGYDQHPMDLAAEGFVPAHPNVEWVPMHSDDWLQKLKAAMAANNGCPDLIWAEATDAQDWGCHELLNDLTDVLKPELHNYHPLKLNETFIAKSGEYIGWPGDLGVSGWYYREDKLKEAGYNDIDFEKLTWPDFLAIAKDLKEKGMYSFVFPSDGWSPLYMYALHQLGGTAVSKDGQQITIGDEKGIRAMQIVKQLWDVGGLDVGWWSQSYWAALKEGKLIGDFASAWVKGFWEVQLKESGDNGGVGHWRIAKFPMDDDIKYRTGVWISSQLVNPKCGGNNKDALDFMQYALGTVEGASRCGKWGIIPAYHPYLESKDFLDLRSPIFGDWEFTKFWANQEKELSPEFYRPAGWQAVNDVISTEMVPVLKGEESVEDGMKRIIDIATPDFERTRCK
jgi:ABC-type glycerol-3-phosphate transport system substrate-binding protein